MIYYLGVFFLMYFVSVSTPIYGYLDPATGNVIINIIIGIIAAFSFSLKKLFYFVLSGKKEVLNKTKKKVAFFSEGKQYWETFKPLIDVFLEKEVEFNYYTLDIEDPALDIEAPGMKSQFLGYGFFASLRFYNIDAPILLSTTPNIGAPNYPLKKPKRTKNMVHVFHSLTDISIYKKNALDYYDTVILAGSFQESSIREVEAKRQLPSKTTIVLGLPYLDTLISNKKRCEKREKKTILIGSSWGNKGCLKQYEVGFIKRLADSDNYTIIIRPHPQSLKIEKEMIETYKRELDCFSNVTWDESLSPTGSMSKADILISDTSSIRYDFSFIYEKPVITLDITSEDMKGYEREDITYLWDQEATLKIGYKLTKNNIDNLPFMVEKALAEFTSISIRDFRDDTVKNIGYSSVLIRDYLVNGLLLC